MSRGRIIQLEGGDRIIPPARKGDETFQQWRARKPEPRHTARLDRWQRDGIGIVLRTLPDSIPTHRRKVIAGGFFALSGQLERGAVGNPIPRGSTEKIIGAIRKIEVIQETLEGIPIDAGLAEAKARLQRFLEEHLEPGSVEATATRNSMILGILFTLAEDHSPAQSRRIFLKVCRTLGEPLLLLTPPIVKKVWDDRENSNFLTFLGKRRKSLRQKNRITSQNP